ncbi:uncharacterized protein KZ484_010995 [Pholidichthys leucotaenia]
MDPHYQFQLIAVFHSTLIYCFHKRCNVPQQNEFNQEEVLDEQQLLHQERDFIVVQVGADCSQIKEEQEDVCISQGGEQFGLKQEPQTFEDAPQLHDCKEEEVLTVQQLCKQESNSSLDQEEQNTAQVQEEEEELYSSLEEEHLGLKQETDASMVTPTDEDNDKSETEPNGHGGLEPIPASLGERQGTPWTDCQSIAGPTQRETQPFTLHSHT